MSRPGPLPGRTLLSRQVNWQLPFRVVRAKVAEVAVGAQARDVDPEERRKCRQGNGQDAKARRSRHDTPTAKQLQWLSPGCKGRTW